jgi:outer membrane protein W
MRPAARVAGLPPKKRRLVRIGGLALSTAALAAASHSAAGDLALELRGGYFDMTNASRSAEALFGTRGGPLVGAALRLDLGENLFARLGVSLFRQTGERAFVDGDDVFPLGHPLEVRVASAYLDVAHRFFRDGSLRPYVGFGVGGMALQEESEVAGETLSHERRKPSARVFVGATWGGGSLQLGAELSYARTPDAIGIGGVSEIYGENDLGGAAAVVTLSWRP